jgi:hypothetical protein
VAFWQALQWQAATNTGAEELEYFTDPHKQDPVMVFMVEFLSVGFSVNAFYRNF